MKSLANICKLILIFACTLMFSGCSYFSNRNWIYLLRDNHQFLGHGPYVLYETTVAQENSCRRYLFLIVQAERGKDYAFVQKSRDDRAISKGLHYGVWRFRLRRSLLLCGDTLDYCYLRYRDVDAVYRDGYDEVIDLSRLSAVSKNLCRVWVYCGDEHGIDISLPSVASPPSPENFVIEKFPGCIVGEFSSFDEVIRFLSQGCYKSE